MTLATVATIIRSRASPLASSAAGVGGVEGCCAWLSHGANNNTAQKPAKCLSFIGSPRFEFRYWSSRMVVALPSGGKPAEAGATNGHWLHDHRQEFYRNAARPSSPDSVAQR